jgi:hypothetical protein
LDIRIAEKWPVFGQTAQKTVQTCAKYGLLMEKSANGEARWGNFEQKWP